MAEWLGLQIRRLSQSGRVSFSFKLDMAVNLSLTSVCFVYRIKL